MSHRAWGVSRLFDGLSRRRRQSPAAAQVARAARCALEGLESRLLYSTVPNDPEYPTLQWHLNNTGQVISGQAGTPGDDIDAEKAWDITTGSSDVVVAVLDTGIDLTHPDLINNIYHNDADPINGIDDDHNGFIDDNTGWNFVDNTNDVTDDVDHGTHVSGIIGAEGNNGIGVAGVNWHVKILPVKVLGPQGGTDEGIVQGIQYITALKNAGVNIVAINASLGNIDITTQQNDTAEYNAIKAAGEAGIVFVAAAGNSNSNVDRTFAFPAKLSLSLPNVIAVAATDNQDEIASFSNFGADSVDVAAPGVDVESTLPPSTYGPESGTSMAAPVVTGIIALEKAVNPGASVAQLRQALLSSVDSVPSLGSNFSLLPLVSTGGRVNAYRALTNILNQFVGTDTTTRGDWHGVYGSQAPVVFGDSAGFPNFVDASITDGNIVTPQPIAKSRTALQRETDPATRLVGEVQALDSFDVNLDFSGTKRRVSLYFGDPSKNGKKRSEQITLIDNNSGNVIDQRVVTNFSKGQYLTWDLSGNVDIHISRLKGPDAILNGVFFDNAPTDATPFVGVDTTHRGNWQGAYGSQSAYVIGQSTASPGFAPIFLNGDVTGDTIRENPSSQRALQKIGDSGRIVGYWQTGSSMTIDQYFTDDQPHQVAIYAVDFDKKNRHERIDLIDPDSGALLDTHDLSNFTNGQYLVWNITSSHVQFRVTNLSAGNTAVISGLFYDGAPGVQGRLVGVDSTTRGNWFGKYGTTNAFGASTAFVLTGFNASSPPPFSGLTFDADSFPELVNDSTTNVNALRKPGTLNDRIVAYQEGRSSLTMNFDFHNPLTGEPDPTVHQVAFYAVDFDKKHRKERFDVIDPETGQVIASQELDDFRNGKYVVFELSGQVQVRITRLGGPTVVVSGVFFD